MHPIVITNTPKAVVIEATTISAHGAATAQLSIPWTINVARPTATTGW